jgi:hypothetical protein
VIDAYENTINKKVAASLDIRFKHIKTGKTIKANMIMVPIAFAGHLMSMHFFKEI